MGSVKERKADYDLMAAVMICLGKEADSGTDLFPRAMSQAAVLARPVGECREGQIPRCSAALQA